MRRQHAKLFSPAIGRDMEIIGYGHAGMPVLVFPSSNGSAIDYENFGMIDALKPFIEAGKLRMYCVGSYDAEGWWARNKPPHERAWRHSLYEDWILNQAIPAIHKDIGKSDVRLITTGCSFGAFHSVLFTLKHPKQFRMALAMSGAYDIRWLLDGYHDDWVYFNNPVEFVPNLHGQLLDELRKKVFIALVTGQGPYEQKAIDSSWELWGLLDKKGIPNYLDLWGYDVAHDWPWWRVQIVHFMKHLVEGRSPWPNISLV